MAVWRPKSDEAIAKNEHVGRRLFDEPMLAGAPQQNNYKGLLLRHFQEKRGREFSLDRLGRSGIDRKVVGYLVPRANAAGKSFKPTKAFHGWAVIRAGILSTPPFGAAMSVLPSPIEGSDLQENIYHAHAILPDGGDSYAIALHLKWLFTSQGSVEPVAPEQQPRPRLTAVLTDFLNRLRKRFGSFITKTEPPTSTGQSG